MLQKGVFYFCFYYFKKTHTNFDTQKHMCVGNGVNIFRAWYCSTCSSIVRVLNCANVIIKIGMISYGKSRFLVFQIIVIIIPPIYLSLCCLKRVMIHLQFTALSFEKQIIQSKYIVQANIKIIQHVFKFQFQILFVDKIQVCC